MWKYVQKYGISSELKQSSEKGNGNIKIRVWKNSEDVDQQENAFWRSDQISNGRKQINQGKALGRPIRKY